MSNIRGHVDSTSHRATSRVAAPSTSSLHVWKAWTHQVLTETDSNVTAASYQTLIQWWCRQRPLTADAARTTWHVWDLHWKNAHGSLHPTGVAHHGLLNTILDHWRLSLKSRIPVPYSTRNVWDKLMSYQTHGMTYSRRTYSLVLSALAYEPTQTYDQKEHGSSPNIALAHEILHHFLVQESMGRLGETERADEHTVVVWNSVLTVVAKQGRGQGHQAEAILRRMRTTSTRPNVITYATVLDAWAGAAVADTAHAPHTAGTNAERIWREMLERPESSCFDISPGNSSRRGLSFETAHSTCLLHVLRAWSQCIAPDGAERANQILQEIVSRYQQHQFDCAGGNSGHIEHTSQDTGLVQCLIVKPTQHCFSAVMSGYASRGNLSKVQELLLQLQALYLASGCRDKLLYPSTTTFNSVLEAFGKQRTPSSALQAHQLLERLFQATQSANLDDSGRDNSSFRPCLPDTNSVNTVLNAWIDSGAPDGLERVEALLESSKRWPGIQFDIVTHTTLMKAWSQSQRPGAPQRCEEILHHMWQQYETQSVNDTDRRTVHRTGKPGMMSYATVIYAWSRAAQHNPDAPLRAESIYRDMVERWQNGDMDLKPTLSIYVSLISAWTRSSRKESDIRAQLYFDQVRGKYMAGDETLRPNDKIYNALISSKKRRGDGQGAERILKQMYNDYSSQGNASARPNRIVFRNVMLAWFNSSSRNAPQRIEAMLWHMQKEHETRKWDCQPGRDDFELLFQCWNKLDATTAATRVNSLLKRWYTQSRNVDDISLEWVKLYLQNR